MPNRKITVLLHPVGKFWAAVEDNSMPADTATELLFGNSAVQTQWHRHGYVNRKIGEKLGKGYIALLDRAVVPDAVPIHLEKLTRGLKDFCVSGNVALIILNLVDALEPSDHFQMTRAMREHFGRLPGQIQSLAQARTQAEPPAPEPVPPAPKPKPRPKKPAPVVLGPWSW